MKLPVVHKWTSPLATTYRTNDNERKDTFILIYNFTELPPFYDSLNFKLSTVEYTGGVIN